MTEAFDAQKSLTSPLSSNQLELPSHARQVRVEGCACRRRPQLLQQPRGATGALVTADRSEAAGASAQAAESR
jgi:hypothetical protein